MYPPPFTFFHNRIIQIYILQLRTDVTGHTNLDFFILSAVIIALLVYKMCSNFLALSYNNKFMPSRVDVWGNGIISHSLIYKMCKIEVTNSIH